MTRKSIYTTLMITFALSSTAFSMNDDPDAFYPGSEIHRESLNKSIIHRDGGLDTDKMATINDNKIELVQKLGLKHSSKGENFTLSTSCDNSQYVTGIPDQGRVGACTSYSATTAMEFVRKRDGLGTLNLSERFLYEGNLLWDRGIHDLSKATTQDYIQLQDVGSFTSTSIGVLCTSGICTLQLAPVNNQDFSTFQRPLTQEQLNNAKNHMTLQTTVKSLNNDLNTIKSAIANKYPVIFGVPIYSSAFTQRVQSTGKIPMPGPKDVLQGGHALCMVGYDDRTQLFKFANSWSTSWGERGFGYFPYDYITKFVIEPWAIKDVKNPTLKVTNDLGDKLKNLASDLEALMDRVRSL